MPGQAAAGGRSFFEYTRSEQIADGAVHIVGIVFGLIAAFVIAALTFGRNDQLLSFSVAVYATGLLAMLGCSALYNLTRNSAWKGWLRRLDHAAIFVMIAGTYTPFALIAIGGEPGWWLFSFVWAIAAIGVVLKLAFPHRFERSSTVAYLLLGWTIVVAIDQLVMAVSLTGLALLAIGGVLYTAGTAFHLATRLPYHNAIWHLFVLGAAGCHFAAVVGEVVQG